MMYLQTAERMYVQKCIDSGKKPVIVKDRLCNDGSDQMEA